MSERPDGGDPDATVMIPGGAPVPGPDSDATVMQPAPGPDPDATVMIPNGAHVRGQDSEATVMQPAPSSDPDATVMIPGGGPVSDRDSDTTGMMPASESCPVPDSDATVMLPSGGPAADAAAMLPADAPDPEATVAIPTPGRKRDAIPATPATVGDTSVATLGELGGVNLLVAAANPILAVVPQIRHALRHPDPEGLRASLRQGIDAFASAARAAGTNEETLTAASYALCALLDESAACTPWGAHWSSDGLLLERHGDSVAAEKYFELMSKSAEDPASNLELLEFFYIGLALGFEGRYRTVEKGVQELTDLRTRLRDQIRAYRPAYDGELSHRWRGVSAPGKQLPGALVFWAAVSCMGLILVVAYLGYSLSLGALSDPVARELAQLKVAGAAGASATLTATSSRANPGIAAQLAAEIGRGEVVVSDAAGRSTIVIKSDRLFASGSARLEREVEGVVLRVAEALDRVPGTIMVTGHTDDVPIRTARFPSNWELSAERAASVVKLMSAKLRDSSRLRTEGLADSEPVAPNDSIANRARNRRVTIILRSGA